MFAYMKNALFFACVYSSCAAYVCAAQPMLDDGLTRMVEKVKGEEGTSASEKLYRKRLLTLLPLIRQSGNVNLTTPETKGNTALHYACSLGEVGLVECLLKLGADPNARTDKGATPLHCAGGKDALRIQSVLRQYGAAH